MNYEQKRKPDLWFSAGCSDWFSSYPVDRQVCSLADNTGFNFPILPRTCMCILEHMILYSLVALKIA